MGARFGQSAAGGSQWLTSRAWRRMAKALLVALLAMWVVSGCQRGPSSEDLRVKAGYVAFGNVELYRDGPERIMVRSRITHVQYAVLFPFVATTIAALASAYAYRSGRRRRRPSDWALPLGSTLVAVLLGAVGYNAMTVDTVIDRETKMLSVEAHRFWGTIPQRSRVEFARVEDIRIVYRAQRGAFCGAVARLSPGDGNELPLFRYVDIFTEQLDLAKCEHLRHRVAEALETDARSDPEERVWW